ncbi:hypothetical protein GW742_25295 [Citrobacter freundii]|nr:hypothetical protein [Citrobacter freundii]MBC6509582.1 hypothetical protein [Citrobacter freundii]
MNKIFSQLLMCFLSFQVNAVCGVKITQGLPELTARKEQTWKVPSSVDLSSPGTVYVLNPGGNSEPVITSISSTNYLAYYLPGWVRVLSNDGPFSIALKLAAWDSVNGISHEVRMLPEIASPWIILGKNMGEIKIPIDERFSGKEIGYGIVINANMTTGMYLKVEDGMCHPSVSVGGQYTFTFSPVVRIPAPPEIRDANGNLLWKGSWADIASSPYYPPIGQLYYNEIADVRVDVSPASLDFGNILFDEMKSLPVTITTISNAKNTKIELKYEFIDEEGEATHKIDATGIDGLSDVITSSPTKNGSVVTTRNVSVTNKNYTAGLYKGHLRITASIP